jgi:biopolymer transport protein ExbB
MAKRNIGWMAAGITLAGLLAGPAVAEPTAGGHALSPWGMFMAADWVVKSVMIGLAGASVATWTIFVAKLLELSTARRRALASLNRLDTVRGLADATAGLNSDRDPATPLLRAVLEELEQSADLPPDGIKERAASRLERTEAATGRAVARGTGILASIGATAPFVGLFGTVWGIMNSFIGIAESHTTNLAVVAPGIAEALLATAIGLVAAIPAVLVYNTLTRSIGGYRAQVGDIAAAILRLLSRDLDRRGVKPRLRAAE